MTALARSPRVFLPTLFLLLPLCQAQDPELFHLSPVALDAARVAGIEPHLIRLSALGSGVSLDSLLLHQQISEAVMLTSLNVDTVVDQLDNERAQIVELQSILLARRQRALGTTNLATLALGTGLGAVSGLLQFSESTKSAGNAIGFAAGGISSLLSFRSFRQQRSGVRPSWSLPGMLTPFLTDTPAPDQYPADTWAWLSTTRRDRLTADWRATGRFISPTSPESLPKIALLTATDASNRKLTMDLLSERSAMLADVRGEVSILKRHLAEILTAIRLP